MIDKSKYQVLQDDKGDWYWIPNNKVTAFGVCLREILGKDYMDDPDAFDFFEQSFGYFRTGGDKNLMPKNFEKYL